MSQAILDNNSKRPHAEMAIAPKQKALAENFDRHFDFIVCGAGASGCVIAGRLSANPDVKVLLLEAGESDELEVVMIPPFGLGPSAANWIGVLSPRPILG